MVQGQILDLQSKKEAVPTETLHRLKTAALFRAAFEFGAIVADADRSTFTTLSLFGERFGLLFQAIDDLDDGDHFISKEEMLQHAHSIGTSLFATLERLHFDTSPLKAIVQNILDSVLCPS